MKKTKTIEVGYVSWYDGIGIDNVINNLLHLKELGATHLSTEEDISFDVTYVREETDEEYERRMLSEKSAKELAEAREYSKYLELKFKYEGVVTRDADELFFKL
jgi:hypothetical protein